MIEWDEIIGSSIAKVWTGQTVGRVHRDYGSQEECYIWNLNILNTIQVSDKRFRVKGSCKTKKAAKAALIRTWMRWCSRMGLQSVPKGHHF